MNRTISLQLKHLQKLLTGVRSVRLTASVKVLNLLGGEI